MSKKVLFLAAVLSFLLLTKPNLVNAEENVSSDDSGLVTGFKYHDNAVTFKLDVGSSTLWNVGFIPDEGCVTDGQDKKGYFHDLIGKDQTFYETQGQFHFTCGRKGSTKVADWFNARTRNGNYTTFGHSASKLNFAVRGLFIISLSDRILVLDDFVLAQGHALTSNNWWCGVNNIFHFHYLPDIGSAIFQMPVLDRQYNLIGLERVQFHRGDRFGGSPNVVKVKVTGDIIYMEGSNTVNKEIADKLDAILRHN